MTWFKVDDGFHDHPKVVELQGSKRGNDAIALWLLAGTWCARHLTDGHVPHAQVARLGFKQASAEDLVRVGLWSAVDGGYAVHDWQEHQPSRDLIEDKRRVNRERLKRWRQQRAEAAENSECNGVSEGVSNSVSEPSGNGVSNASPVPSRPVPSRPSLKRESAHEAPSAPLDPPGYHEGVSPTGGIMPTPRSLSGAHNQEVREGWAEAYEAAGAGAPPRLSGQPFVAAVDFASTVSRTHNVPLRQAARDIATAVLKRGDKASVFAFAELDPYADRTPRRKSLAELRPGFVPNPGA